MKILYTTNVRIPTQKAHGIQVMQMCRSFARANASVELMVPRRINTLQENPFRYYGIEKTFKITKIATLDTIILDRWLGPAAYWIQLLTFYVATATCLLFGSRKRVVYTRDSVGVLLRLLGYRVFCEVHDIPARSNMFLRLLSYASGIITITQGLKDDLVERGVAKERVSVAPDGVDLDRFDIAESKTEARELLGLPQDKKIVLYTGHLYHWKGVDVLVRAAVKLKNVQVILLGGSAEEQEDLRMRVGMVSEHVSFIGAVPHNRVPMWLAAADVLVLPNSGKTQISRSYTSPLKMFEYMASKRPIVASSLPSIREVLNDGNAHLVEPDNPEALHEGLEKALHGAEGIAQRAYDDVKKYLWENRTRNILKSIGSSKEVSGQVEKYIKITRFIISGGTATMVNLLVLFLLTDFVGMWYIASSVVSFFVAFIASFTLQKFWTFRDYSKSAIRYQVSLYTLTTLWNLLLNTALLYVAVEYISTHYLMGQIFSNAVVAIQSFFIFSKIIFKERGRG